MQGEHHDIDNEFPEFHERILDLRGRDEEFDQLVAHHDEVDDQIRELEERQQPVSDQEMEKLKFERTNLKDRIYHRLKTPRTVRPE